MEWLSNHVAGSMQSAAFITQTTTAAVVTKASLFAFSAVDLPLTITIVPLLRGELALQLRESEEPSELEVKEEAPNTAGEATETSDDSHESLLTTPLQALSISTPLS